MWLYDKDTPNVNPLPPPFLRIGQFSYMPRPLPWLRFPHIHQDEYELSFILSGCGVLNLPGTTYPLKAGMIVLVPPQTAHYFVAAPEADMEYYALRICSPDDDSEAMERFTSLGTKAVDCQRMDILQSLLKTMAALALENNETIDRTVQILGLSVWELTYHEFCRAGYPLKTNAPIYANDILLYLQSHIHEKITLEQLAQHFNLSPSHLSRVFTKAYHISPINYLIASRMGRARTYILNDRLSSAEIAKRLGYQNTYHFTNTFVRFFGCRPEAYYEQVKHREEM